MLRVDGADDDGADARLGEDELHVGLDRVSATGQGMPAVERLLDQHALMQGVREIDDLAILGRAGVVGHHHHITGLRRQPSTGHRLGGHAEGADQSFLSAARELLEAVRSQDDVLVVAVRVHQHQVEIVGAQALQAAFDAAAHVRGAEIEKGFAVHELLADLRADHPVLTVRQQLAEALFAAAIGGRSVDEVDAQLARQGQQLAYLLIIGQVKAGGIFDALIAADLDRAEAKAGDLHAGAAQRTQS